MCVICMVWEACCPLVASPIHAIRVPRSTPFVPRSTPFVPRHRRVHSHPQSSSRPPSSSYSPSFLHLVMPSIGVPAVTGFDIIAQKIKAVASEHAPPSSSSVAVSMATTGRLLHSSFQSHSSGRARVVARDNPILSDNRDCLAKRRWTGCITPASASYARRPRRSMALLAARRLGLLMALWVACHPVRSSV